MVDLIWEKLKMDNAKVNFNAANAKIKFFSPLFFIYFWAQGPWWDTIDTTISQYLCYSYIPN